RIKLWIVRFARDLERDSEGGECYRVSVAQRKAPPSMCTAGPGTITSSRRSVRLLCDDFRHAAERSPTTRRHPPTLPFPARIGARSHCPRHVAECFVEIAILAFLRISLHCVDAVPHVLQRIRVHHATPRQRGLQTIPQIRDLGVDRIARFERSVLEAVARHS